MKPEHSYLHDDYEKLEKARIEEKKKVRKRYDSMLRDLERKQGSVRKALELVNNALNLASHIVKAYNNMFIKPEKHPKPLKHGGEIKGGPVLLCSGQANELIVEPKKEMSGRKYNIIIYDDINT